VAPASLKKVEAALKKSGERVFRIGHIIKRKKGGPGAVILNTERAWPG
jgi:hypothetical protein